MVSNNYFSLAILISKNLTTKKSKCWFDINFKETLTNSRDFSCRKICVQSNIDENADVLIICSSLKRVIKFEVDNAFLRRYKGNIMAVM